MNKTEIRARKHLGWAETSALKVHILSHLPLVRRRTFYLHSANTERKSPRVEWTCSLESAGRDSCKETPPLSFSNVSFLLSLLHRWSSVCFRYVGAETHTHTHTYNTESFSAESMPWQWPVVTVAVHAAASELALEPHPVEASEDAGTMKFALNKFTFIPKKEKKNPIKTPR